MCGGMPQRDIYVHALRVLPKRLKICYYKVLSIKDINFGGGGGGGGYPSPPPPPLHNYIYIPDSFYLGKHQVVERASCSLDPRLPCSDFISQPWRKILHGEQLLYTAGVWRLSITINTELTSGLVINWPHNLPNMQTL